MNYYYLVSLMAVITVITSRLLKKVYKPNYFSINDIVFADEEKVSIWGLLIILCPPYVGGFLLGIINKNIGVELIFFYGLISGFLVIWPVLLYSEELLPHNAYKKMKSIYFLYTLYVIVMSIVAYGGFTTYQTFAIKILPNILCIPTFLSFYDSLHPFFQGILVNAVWFIPTILLSEVITKIKRRIWVKENE